MKRWIVRAIVAGAVTFVLLQLLPFGKVANARVTADAPWPTPESKRLAIAACYDCHSNEVKLQWFDKIAPVSWLVAQHVEEGRNAVNFSEWDRVQSADHLDESVVEGGMPLPSYTWAHPAGRLSATERAALVAALRQIGEPGDGSGGRSRGGRSGDGG